jgi:hypothetical protein
MKLKTSNKILLGYLASLMLIMGATIIFGFSPADSIQLNTNMPDSKVEKVSLESFSVIHVGGKAVVNIYSGSDYSIEYTDFLPDEDLPYFVSNDTLFVNYDVRGVNNAKVQVANLEAIIVDKSQVNISGISQEELNLILNAGNIYFVERKSDIGKLKIEAENGSFASVSNTNHLILDLNRSKVSVIDYTDQISGNLNNSSSLETLKSAGKLDLEKSKDSKILMY